MALATCKNCDGSMVGSHKWAVDDKRCDRCYKQRRRKNGATVFCANCLYPASGNTAKSYRLNNGLCPGCWEGKNKNQIADADYIKSRFGGSSSSGSGGGGCFITTATLNALQKSDDCEELNLFRDFRDNYVIKQPLGRELIQEYYTLAPVIVNKINQRTDCKKVYSDLWFNHLVHCHSALNNNDHQLAGDIYISLIKKLQREYLSN